MVQTPAKDDANSFPPRKRGRLFLWFDRRMGLEKLLSESLDEPIPGGARFAYIFGSGLIFVFLSQAVTGIFLALYYVPSADHAHTTAAYITKAVAAGSFLRSLHVYGASVMVIVVVLHMAQAFFYGSYKGRRELLWVAGCILFLLVLGMAFTGYLLPWDQKAYFATSVGTNILSEIPLVGDILKRLLRGGDTLGTLTLSRFFAAHVFFIPAMIVALMVSHVYLFRKAGAAGPVREDPFEPKLKSEPFYPRQLLRDLSLVLLLIAIIGALALFYPATLGPRANPADTQYLPRPEWYFRPVFQWLQYWHGPLSVVGIVIVPLVIMSLLVALPFYDRRPERRPWRRPVATTLFSFFLAGIVVLGALSYYHDAHEPSVASQLARQDRDTEKYMHTPFQPQAALVTTQLASGAPGPLVDAGRKFYASQPCVACHGQNAMGTPVAPSLAGISKRFTLSQLQVILQHPTAKMKAGGMPAFRFTDDQVKALMAYLDSLQ